MKLIMESWKRFLNEQKPPVDDPLWDKLQPLIPALKQDAAHFFAGDDIDVKKITLAQMALAGCDLPLIDMESVAAITLGDLFPNADRQDIRQSNPKYGSSGMEEASDTKVSKKRSEVTYSKGKRGKSTKPEKEAYNKADRAQAKRELKK
jgi:hypothetical protein